MDHDGIASDTSHGMPEPQGRDEGSPGVTDQSDTGTSGYDDGASGSGTMRVEVDGQIRDLPAEKDYTGDGRPDAATETPDGKVIIFADTEDNETGAAGPDGRADEAYVVDKSTGRVLGAAHLDPRTGEWVDDADPSAVPSEGESS
ncbi:MAG TPA: hypothetical protein VF109_08420 [Mycobacteriales bacterium]